MIITKSNFLEGLKLLIPMCLNYFFLYEGHLEAQGNGKACCDRKLRRGGVISANNLES